MADWETDEELRARTGYTKVKKTGVKLTDVLDKDQKIIFSKIESTPRHVTGTRRPPEPEKPKPKLVRLSDLLDPATGKIDFSRRDKAPQAFHRVRVLGEGGTPFTASGNPAAVKERAERQPPAPPPQAPPAAPPPEEPPIDANGILNVIPIATAGPTGNKIPNVPLSINEIADPVAYPNEGISVRPPAIDPGKAALIARLQELNSKGIPEARREARRGLLRRSIGGVGAMLGSSMRDVGAIGAGVLSQSPVLMLATKAIFDGISKFKEDKNEAKQEYKQRLKEAEEIKVQIRNWEQTSETHHRETIVSLDQGIQSADDTRGVLLQMRDNLEAIHALFLTDFLAKQNEEFAQGLREGLEKDFDKLLKTNTDGLAKALSKAFGILGDSQQDRENLDRQMGEGPPGPWGSRSGTKGAVVQPPASKSGGFMSGLIGSLLGMFKKGAILSILARFLSLGAIIAAFGSGSYLAVAGAIAGWFAGGPLGAIAGGLLGYGLGALFDWLGGVDGIIEKLTDFKDMVMDKISDSFSALSDWYEDTIVEGLHDIMAGSVLMLTKLEHSIKNFVEDWIVDPAVSLFHAIGDGIKTALAKLLDALSAIEIPALRIPIPEWLGGGSMTLMEGGPLFGDGLKTKAEKLRTEVEESKTERLRAKDEKLKTREGAQGTELEGIQGLIDKEKTGRLSRRSDERLSRGLEKIRIRAERDEARKKPAAVNPPMIPGAHGALPPPGGAIPVTPTGGSFGALAMKSESSGNPGAINPNDGGGASYGLFQLNYPKGSLATYLRTSAYGRYFEGLIPTTKAFNEKWREVARIDPQGFGADQREFVMREYYVPVADALRSKGLDISKRGRGVNEIIFSTAIQRGQRRAVGVALEALGGNDPDMISDADLIQRMTQIKSKQVPTYSFRYDREMRQALQMGGGVPSSFDKPIVGSRPTYSDLQMGHVSPVKTSPTMGPEKVMSERGRDLDKLSHETESLIRKIDQLENVFKTFINQPTSIHQQSSPIIAGMPPTSNPDDSVRWMQERLFGKAY